MKTTLKRIYNPLYNKNPNNANKNTNNAALSDLYKIIYKN